MDLHYLNRIDSTQTYLKQHLKEHPNSQNICFYTHEQTNGIGSRDNSWTGKKGNLFFSFCISKNYLPDDLPLQSASIYFSFLFKQCLEKNGSNVWLKWPNDFYINDKKIGGTITHFSADRLLCGIGLNLIETDAQYGYLDVKIDVQKCLIKYLMLVEEKKSWKEIFSLYKIEFHKSMEHKTTIQGEKKTLRDAVLLDDGSITINNKRVYSSR